MLKRSALLCAALAACAWFAIAAAACDSCGCTLARCSLDRHAAEKRWFFDFPLEEHNWNTRTAREAHNLHHQGIHVHNRTHEEFYHFSLGWLPAEEWTLIAELPYVVRHSIEINDHARLGQKEKSEGVGDLRLTA